MTKIKIYPLDTNISGSDKWIGSDSNASNRTKNFSVAGLSDYYNSSTSINLSNAITFKYDTVDIGDDRAEGSFSFETEVGATVPFSSISDLMFHKNSSNGKYIVDLMSYYNGNLVFINKSGDPNIFGVYKINSYEQNLVETDFYDTTLQYLGGNGSIEEDELYFVSLLQLDSLSDTDKHYTHVQGVAASTWTVNHNLDKYPSATMVLSTGQKGYGDVTYIDENTLTITFASAESGKAYIN
jgi:hypothetical protein